MNDKAPHILLPAHGSFSDFLHAHSGAFFSCHPAQFRHCYTAVLLEYHQQRKACGRFGNTTHHQKGKRLQRQAKVASFVCKTVARFGLSAASVVWWGCDWPPPNLPYFIPSLLNRHLEKVGQTCEKLIVRAWGDFYTERILFDDMLRESVHSALSQNGDLTVSILSRSHLQFGKKA